MRAERLLRLLLHLQTRGQSTVAQLSAALGVSPRTIQRDLEVLSLAGVPVYSIRGRGGGWTLLPDYRTRITGLTPSEVMSVFVGATAHVLADLGLDASSDQAVTKLIASLPEGTRREAEYARQRLLIDHAGWDDRRETPRWLDLCREALWEERRLAIIYADGTDAFEVSPLGLVAKARTWYLVAARTDGRLRTYRLSRLTSATLTNTPFTRPADFDLATYWTQSQRELQASRPSYPITLKVRDHAVRRFRPTHPMVPADNGWWILHTDLESPHEARAAVLAQAGAAIVLDPPELITLVHEAALAIYQSGSHSENLSRSTS
ncbi:helix-turn-helix transcriptional regulator [Kribbella pratensis]|uniref:DNA-binding transcriptional regulator YafY n=1 Tax=Kribbella pratensis TaxID=2512112 RepID=A0A4R8BXY7_9ACTN|nr:WYL domain-containing protein [Kribbella pratensis]TDW66436.1 putative DNA-binding transcriptional regulator YafY [Kribbella pratensis]